MAGGRGGNGCDDESPTYEVSGCPSGSGDEGHESLGGADDYRTVDAGEGEVGNPGVGVLDGGFGFGETDVGDL